MGGFCTETECVEGIRNNLLEFSRSPPRVECTDSCADTHGGLLPEWGTVGNDEEVVRLEELEEFRNTNLFELLAVVPILEALQNDGRAVGNEKRGRDDGEDEETSEKRRRVVTESLWRVVPQVNACSRMHHCCS